MKIVFIFSHLPDPRLNKRINLLKNNHEVHLVYWNRKTVQIWDNNNKDVENHEIIIRAFYSNPLKRIIPTIKFSRRAFSIIKKIKPDLIYAFNLDMLRIAYNYHRISKDCKIIYEVADLNSIIIDTQTNILKKIIQKLLIRTEKKMTQVIKSLVITSEKFFDEYYIKFLEKDKVIFIPNIPETRHLQNYRKKSGKVFTIGFIGAIRYVDQMKMLINFADHNDVKVIFAGTGLTDEVYELAKKNKNVEYYGKYNYEKEIAALYSKIDCVYAVYNADLTNVRIALPNKLYEAIYCELPLIVAKGTYLAELVEKWNVGISVNHNDKHDLEKGIMKLMNDYTFYSGIVESCKSIKHIIDNNYYNSKLLAVVYEIERNKMVR